MDCSILESKDITLLTKVHLDSILESKDITLLTKVHIVKAVVFSVVMCECESSIIKNVEC